MLERERSELRSSSYPTLNNSSNRQMHSNLPMVADSLLFSSWKKFPSMVKLIAPNFSFSDVLTGPDPFLMPFILSTTDLTTLTTSVGACKRRILFQGQNMTQNMPSVVAGGTALEKSDFILIVRVFSVRQEFQY